MAMAAGTNRKISKPPASVTMSTRNRRPMATGEIQEIRYQVQRAPLSSAMLTLPSLRESLLRVGLPHRNFPGKREIFGEPRVPPPRTEQRRTGWPTPI